MSQYEVEAFIYDKKIGTIVIERYFESKIFHLMN